MKKFVLMLSVIALLAGTIYGSGAAPAPPSPFTKSGTSIYNITSPSTFFWNLTNSGLYDTLRLWSFGGFKFLAPYGNAPSKWYFGASGAEWDKAYIDTLRLTTTSGRLYIDGDYFYRLDGEGLVSSGGLAAELRAVLGTDISSPEIVDTTIQPADMNDTATTWEFEIAYRADATDSVTADSAYATLRYSRIWVGGKPLSGANPSDNYIPKYDAALDSIMWEADAGATSGDDIKLDSNGSTAGGVWDAPSGTVIQFGTGLVATKLGSDTMSVSTVAGASIELDGDTVNATSIFNWNQSQMRDIDSLYADTISAKYGYVDDITIGTGLLHTGFITDKEDGQGMAVSVQGNAPLVFKDGSTAKFRMERDSLVSDVVGGGITKGWKWMSTDSITVGSVVLGGYVSGVLNPAMAARNVRDSLANYVLKTNENWLDISSDAAIRHYSGLNATDELIRMTRTLNGDDTTTQTVLSGNLKLESPLSVSIIGGPGNPTLDDTLNMNGYNIYGISRAEGDTADFTTYLNVPGLEGMTDSIAAVRSDLDTLNADVAANYLTATATRTAIADSLSVRKWEEMSVVSSWVKPLEDSVYLLDNVVLDRGSATPEQYIVLDSAGDIDVSGGAQLDTFFVVGTIPEAGIVDSFWYTYKVYTPSGTCKIDQIDFMGPTQGDLGVNQCDSVYYTDGTDRQSTSLARVKLGLAAPFTTTVGGLRFAIRFIVSLPADNAWVAIGYAQLGYK